MANTQVVPDKTALKAYLSRGLTQQQIVDAWKRDSGVTVSRSAIAMAIERNGLKSSNPRARYDDLIPWRVRVEHKDAQEVRLLRMEARRRAGGTLSNSEIRWLMGWKEELHNANAVIHYDPDTEQGFWWVERLPEHGDDLIVRPKVSSRSAADE